jgi:hypothetical protein
VHRDVKPGNVLLAGDGSAKITDFGLSHVVGDAPGDGLVAGTPVFLSPEAALGGGPDPASDVFSLGATLYTAVEGWPPFGTADNPVAQLERVAAGQAPPPRRAGPLTHLLTSMLRDDPATRPSMSWVADALADIAAAHGAATDDEVAAGWVEVDPGRPTSRGGRWRARAADGPDGDETQLVPMVDDAGESAWVSTDSGGGRRRAGEREAWPAADDEGESAWVSTDSGGGRRRAGEHETWPAADDEEPAWAEVDPNGREPRGGRWARYADGAGDDTQLVPVVDDEESTWMDADSVPAAPPAGRYARLAADTEGETQSFPVADDDVMSTWVDLDPVTPSEPRGAEDDTRLVPVADDEESVWVEVESAPRAEPRRTRPPGESGEDETQFVPVADEEAEPAGRAGAEDDTQPFPVTDAEGTSTSDPGSDGPTSRARLRRLVYVTLGVVVAVLILYATYLAGRSISSTPDTPSGVTPTRQLATAQHTTAVP